MPQIDLSIINLTIFSVFIIFAVSFFGSILFKKNTFNKVFLFFNTFSKKEKTHQTLNLKKYFQY